MTILRAIFNFFYEICFGCHHERLTRPFTLDRHTYMVCLDCGKQVFYSVEKMAPLSAREVRRMKATEAGELKLVPVTNNGPQLMQKPQEKSSAAA